MTTASGALAAGRPRAGDRPALQVRADRRTQQTGQRLAAVVVRASAARGPDDARHRFAAIVVGAATVRREADQGARFANVIVRAATDGRTRPSPIAPAAPAGAIRPGRGMGADVDGPRQTEPA